MFIAFIVVVSFNNNAQQHTMISHFQDLGAHIISPEKLTTYYLLSFIVTWKIITGRRVPRGGNAGNPGGGGPLGP